MLDRNCLSYWYPRLHAAGLPQPKTEIVRCSERLDSVLDGKEPACWKQLMLALESAAEIVGRYPVFLRTGHGSDKHDYSRTCYISKPEDFPSHVSALVEWSALVDILGLSTNIWAVREYLRLPTVFKAFRGMPVAPEWRFFVRDGKKVCHHPYWPAGAIEEGCHQESLPDDWRAVVHHLGYLSSDGLVQLNQLAVQAGRALGGSWSIDFCRDVNGKYWLTDCALAGHSFHWDDCPNKNAFPREEALTNV